MKKLQVWIRGSDLFDVMAEDEKEAKQIVRVLWVEKITERNFCVPNSD